MPIWCFRVRGQEIYHIITGGYDMSAQGENQHIAAGPLFEMGGSRNRELKLRVSKTLGRTLSEQT